MEKKQLNFLIYRLCKNENIKNQLIRDTDKYKLPKTIFKLGSDVDYFTFLNDIIKNCETDFALVCHDDVILPINIGDKVVEAISGANNEFGIENWGVIGNAGLDFLSKEMIRYVKDPNDSIIPPASHFPRPVISIDGNTLLINIKNARKNNVQLPNTLKGFHLYDLCLLVEMYKKKLICAVDSRLYVVHKSSGNTADFYEKVKDKAFVRYWFDSFSNKKIFTVVGDIEIENKNIKKTLPRDIRKDFYKEIKNIIEINYSSRAIKDIVIIIRTQFKRRLMLFRLLDSIEKEKFNSGGGINTSVVLSVNNPIEGSSGIIDEIKEKYADTLEIKFVLLTDVGEKFPRVAALKCAVDSTDKKCFFWIIDDDDFVLPNALKSMKCLLNDELIFVGNSVVFEENWAKNSQQGVEYTSKKKHVIDSSGYYKNITGFNHTPICSVLYPSWVLQEVFDKQELLGDYFEDYAIFMLAQNIVDVSPRSISIAGISYHEEGQTVCEKDRTHWDYSYATFVSEIVNNGITKKTFYDYLINKERQIAFNNDVNIPKKSNYFRSSYVFISRYLEIFLKAWRILRGLGIKKFAIYLYKYVRYGRSYFKDGVVFLEKYK